MSVYCTGPSIVKICGPRTTSGGEVKIHAVNFGPRPIILFHGLDGLDQPCSGTAVEDGGVISCNIGAGAGTDVCTLSVWNEEANLTSRPYPLSFPSPEVDSISMANDASSSQMNTIGGQAITIRGRNFGVDPHIIQVWIGKFRCKDVKIVCAHEEISCSTPPGELHICMVLWGIFHLSGLQNYCTRIFAGFPC